MAVAFVGSAAGVTALGTTVSFSYTAGAGTDRLIVAGGHSTDTINSATWDGVAMAAVTGAANGAIKSFQLAGGATGTKTLAFSLSAYNGVRYAAADFSGVDQTTPVGSGVNATGAAATVSTGSITVPSGGMAWGYGHHSYTPALTINDGALAGVATGFGTSWAGAYRGTTGALAWNSSGGGTWVAVGFPINAAGGMTGNFDLADMVLSGTFATGALSQLAGGITLDDFVLGGFLGLAPGRVDTAPFKNWSGTLLPGVTVPNVVFLKLDRSKPLDLANQTTAGDGVMTITNAALTPGTYYIMVSFDATGANIGAELVLAA